MADGRHFDKTKNRHICTTVWQSAKIFCTIAHWFCEPYPRFKDRLVKHARWRTPPFWGKTL